MTDAPRTSWLALAGAFTLGLLAWGVPIAAVVLAYFFAMNKPGIGPLHFVIVAGAAAAFTLMAPVGLMVWQRWHQAAIAYAVGMVVGVGPLGAIAAWFLLFL